MAHTEPLRGFDGPGTANAAIIFDSTDDPQPVGEHRYPIVAPPLARGVLVEIEHVAGAGEVQLSIALPVLQPNSMLGSQVQHTLLTPIATGKQVIGMLPVASADLDALFGAGAFTNSAAPMVFDVVVDVTVDAAEYRIAVCFFQ